MDITFPKTSGFSPPLATDGADEIIFSSNIIPISDVVDFIPPFTDYFFLTKNNKILDRQMDPYI
jgi:hypothetical protein